jgi:Ran GTPase-activating protein (RanGAP) involved in mRNA processing and transport
MVNIMSKEQNEDIQILTSLVDKEFSIPKDSIDKLMNQKMDEVVYGKIKYLLSSKDIEYDTNFAEDLIDDIEKNIFKFKENFIANYARYEDILLEINSKLTINLLDDFRNKISKREDVQKFAQDVLKQKIDEFNKYSKEKKDANYLNIILELHHLDIITKSDKNSTFKKQLIDPIKGYDVSKYAVFLNSLNNKSNQYVTKLDLSKSNLGIDGAIALAHLLENNQYVTKLDLSDNNIGKDGAEKLAQALKKNKTITTLYLSLNNIGSKGAIALTQALEKNPTITELNFGWNSIGKDGAKALADMLKENETITTLNLSGNEIGKDGVIALAEALEKNKTIKTLNLSNSRLGIDGAKALAQALENNPTITKLDLKNNNIGKDGAEELAKALKENKTLTELDLSDNNIGKDGAKELAEALEKNKTITKLNLSLNNIGKDGAKKLAEALEKNKTITELDLRWNSITSSQIIELGEACANRNDDQDKTIATNIKFTYLPDDHLFKLISGQFTGDSIDLSYVSNLSLGELSLGYFQKVINALKENTKITELNLSGNNIGDKEAKALADMLKENTKITKLNLLKSNLGKDGAEELADMLKENKKIKTLNLSNSNLGKDGAKALADMLKENKTLTELDLSLNNIGDKGAEELAKALKENTTLTTLKLSDNNIGDKGAKVLAEALKENKTLTKLDLRSNNNIGDKQVIALGEACKDKKNITVYFSDDKKNNLFELISGQFKSDSIDLSELSLGALSSEYFQKVIKALKENKTLTKLNLKWSNITSSQIIALGELCTDNNNITVDFGDDNKKNFFELISDQFTGDSIYLSNLSLGELSSEDSKKVIDAIKKNKTIKTLGLSSNNIGDKGAEELAQALKKNKTITTLYLSSNNIREAGVIALAQALKENTTLKTLNLSDNDITSSQIIKLGEVCANRKDNQGKTIATNIEFGNPQKNNLFKLISGQFTGYSIDLSLGELSPEYFQKVIDAIKENTTITTLNLKWNKIEDKQIIALGIACKDKKNITVNFADDEENNLFKLAQKYGNKKAESSYSFNIPAAATEIFTASTIIALLTIITLSILASQGIIAFDSAAFIAPVASVGAINLVTFIGFAITEVTSKVMDYKNVSEYNKVHEDDKGFKPQKVHWLNPCHKVQFVDKVSQEQNNNEKTPVIGK